MTAPDMLTVAEVAGELRRTRDFVYNEIKRKHLRAAKIGTTFNVRRSDLDDYIEDRMNVSRVRRAS